MSAPYSGLWDNPESNSFIYALIDPRNDQIKYIGQTSCGLQRIRQHYYNKDTEGKNSKKCHWVNKLKKLGLVFKVLYLEYTQGLENLNKLETFYIQKFKTSGCELLNHYEGGDSFHRESPSDELKQYLSIKSKEAWQDPEKRKRLIGWRKGRISPLKGTKKSEEFKSKIRQANKKLSISVICSDGRIFNSYLEASKQIGCTPTDIRRCILNPNKQIKGLTFTKYSDA